MWQHQLALKIIFAKKDITVLKDQLKVKHFYVQLVLTATFQELESLLIVQFVPPATIALTKQWTLSLAQSAIIVQLAWNLLFLAPLELLEQVKV